MLHTTYAQLGASDPAEREAAAAAAARLFLPKSVSAGAPDQSNNPTKDD
jgi:hypothetical protein